MSDKKKSNMVRVPNTSDPNTPEKMKARLKEQMRRTRTERELERLGEGMSSAPKEKAKKKKAKKKPTEKRSTRGTSNDEINAGAERAMQPLREQLRDAVMTGKKTHADKLRQRLLALQQSKL